jgi:CMP/dCMP kinase
MMNPGLRVAIDGPAGVGKSTAARGLALRLGYQYVDTGAMYRAVAVLARRRGLGLDDGDALAALASVLRFTFPAVEGEQRTVVDGEDLSVEIRTPGASSDASRVSRAPQLRAALVALQQALADGGGVVMEGRDIGTVVMPDAELKVFMDADARVRGERRLGELVARGRSDAQLDEVVAEIVARDHQDSTRAASPLRPAGDAVRLDTTGLGAGEVLDRLEALVKDAAQRL